MPKQASGCHVFWVDQLDGKLSLYCHIMDDEGCTISSWSRFDLVEGDFWPVAMRVALIVAQQLLKVWRARA